MFSYLLLLLLCDVCGGVGEYAEVKRQTACGVVSLVLPFIRILGIELGSLGFHGKFLLAETSCSLMLKLFLKVFFMRIHT